MGGGSQKVQTSNYKISEYSMVTIVNSTVFFILKLLRE